MYALGTWSEAISGQAGRNGGTRRSWPCTDERDCRLGEAIDGYLDQLQDGQPVSPVDWAQRFPEIADELRECLDALALVGPVSLSRPRTGGVLCCNGRLPGLLAESPPGCLSQVTKLPTLPGYTVLGEIGRGGMGVVYRARQNATRRLVALKFLASGCYASASARRRFAREVELAAALDHPSVVRVMEAGESAAGLYCAMELVDGEPLHLHLARHKPSLGQKLRLFLRVVDAVHYAHLRAVIHRDLKPSNIMVDNDGQPRILDFGLARSAPGRDQRDEPSRVTQDGQVVGTLPYLSPEQAVGATTEVDLRSDLYALGVILYEMLTGRLPYETEGALDSALHNICHAVPPRPSHFCRQLNGDIDAVVLKALEKSKDDRYQTAAELAEDIRCCLRGEPAQANRTSRFYLLRKAYTRHRMQVRLAAAGLALVWIASAVILCLYLQVQRERDRLEEQLHVSKVRRGLAHVAAGHDRLAENLLQAAYRDRPDARAYWSLLTYYVQNPLLCVTTDQAWITCLAYSPDQRFLAEGTLTGTVSVRDARTLKLVRSIKAHSGAVASLAFSSSGDSLATGGADGRIKLWRPSTGELVEELGAHPGGVIQLRFVPTQGWLVSAGEDGRAILWDVRGTGSPHVVFADARQQPIMACDLSGCGSSVALATSTGALWIIDLVSGEHRAGPLTFPHGVEAVRFSPDGRAIAVWSNAEVSLWDLASNTRLWGQDAGLAEPRPRSLWAASPKPHVCWRPSLAFSGEGSLLAAGGWDGVVRMWRPATGDPLGELRAHGAAVYAVAFQPGSHRLAASSLSTIRIWDLDHHRATLSHKLPPASDVGPVSRPVDSRTCVAVSDAAGLMAWASATDDGAGEVSLMRTAPPHDVTTWRAHATPVEAIALDPDGQLLATADRGGTLTLWNVAGRRKVRGWSTGGQRVRALAFSPDGTRVATGDCEGQLQVWRVADGSLEHGWAAHRGPVLTIAFSPDGSRLASGGTDWRARLWELGRPEPVAERRHVEWVNALAFSSDGSQLATTGADLTIHVGPAEVEPRVKIIGSHAHWVNALAFLDQGRVVVSGGNDAAIRFWDSRNGQELATLSSPGGPIHSLAVTHDERYLALGAARAVQLIDLGTAAELIQQKAVR